MITTKIETEDGTETWQAAKRDDGWYIRQDPDIQWSDEPFAAPEAKREDVLQLLRKEKDHRY